MLGLTLAPAWGAEAQDLFVPDPGGPNLLAPYLSVLEEQGPVAAVVARDAQTVEQVAHAGEQSWRPAPRDGSAIAFGFSSRPHWLRLQIDARSAAQTQWLLHLAGGPVDSVELYLEQPGGGYQVQRAGQALAFDQQSLAYKDPLFLLSFDPSRDVQTLYLRVRHSRRLAFVPSLVTPAAFLESRPAMEWGYWLYFGVLFTMALYNGLLYAWVRERSFLFLALAALSLGLNSMVRNGFAAAVLWPRTPALNGLAYAFFTYLAAFWVIAFSRSFLGTARKVPAADKAVLALAVATLANLVLKTFADGPRVSTVAAGTNVLAVVLIMGVALYLWLARRDRDAGLFVATSSLAAVGILLDIFGVSQPLLNDRTGLGLQMILFSLAVAERFNRVRRENERLEREVRERRQAEEQARHQAHHDPLTELPNRALFSQEFGRQLATARARGTRLAVMFVDLDEFKGVNDQLGHEAGDQLLVEVARRLRMVLRRGDLVARVGGDEFSLVFEVSDEQEARRIAERILGVFREPAIIEGHTIPLRPSIGVSLFPDDGEEPHLLLRKADAAMYAAKRHEALPFHIYGETLKR